MQNQPVAYANIFANIDYQATLDIIPNFSDYAYDIYKKDQSKFPEITEYLQHPRFSDQQVQDIFYNHEDLPFSIDFNFAKALNLGDLVSFQVFTCLDTPIQNVFIDSMAASECLFLLTSKGYRTESIINLRFEAIYYEDIKEARQDFISGKWSNFRSLETIMDKRLSSFSNLDYYKVLSSEEIKKYEGTTF
tara:strand:+ start:150 stop:722 length:573 start_codon:yes stop_codon:yes gene_type:complete